MPLADVPAKHTSERPVTARMAAIELTVRANIRERPGDDLLDVALVHRRRDDRFTGRTTCLGRIVGVLDQRHQGSRRVGTTLRRDPRDRLAGVFGMWTV